MSTEADQIVRLYRRHARAWAELRGSDLQEKKWLDRFVQLLPVDPSILDVGCGSGNPIGRYLVENGCALTGIDSSSELIEIAHKSIPEADWMVSDMRNLRIGAKFNGILAWNSIFHLTPDDQRQMFPVFERHAAPAAALMFTSGPSLGDAIGEFEGEALYHSSLGGDDYRTLLDQHGFEVIDHAVEDPECGRHTVWLAQFQGCPLGSMRERTRRSPSSRHSALSGLRPFAWTPRMSALCAGRCLMTKPRRYRRFSSEFKREALSVTVATKMGAAEVLDALFPLLLKHGKPEHLRSDNEPEFTSAPFRARLKCVGISSIQIYPGSTWEIGYNERFNGTLRREVVNTEWFATTTQAQTVINTWLRQYNHFRPHQALGMRPPVPETLVENGQISGTG